TPNSSTFLVLSRLIPPRHPSTKLFAYTTLFRSDIEIVIEKGFAERHFICAQKHGAQCAGMVECNDGATRRGIGPECAIPQANGQDRKSTRLNSSHVKNSYAVFSLKKKTGPDANH